MYNLCFRLLYYLSLFSVKILFVKFHITLLLNRNTNGSSTTDTRNNCKGNNETLKTFKHKKNVPNNKELFHDGIILCRISQSSQIFAGPGQGLQCIANCMLSLIYNIYKSCKFWTSKDLTQILYSGNILYNATGKATTLLVSELPKHIQLYSSIYKVGEKNSIIGY